MLNRYHFIFLILVQSVCISGVSHLTPENNEKLFNKLAAYSGEKTFIFSFVGSGNTWIRYCLEYLTRRPSFARWWNRQCHRFDLPLGLIAKFPIDLGKPPLEKVHARSDILKANGSASKDLLIFILRNPKEAFVRDFPSGDLLKFVNFGTMTAGMKTYLDDIETFDSWSDDKKILIYYEDLITAPEKTLSALLQFLNEPLDPLIEFMINYKMHKQNGLGIKAMLSPNLTKGEKTTFYSEKLTKKERLQIDNHIIAYCPGLWEKYLKDAYAEEENQ